MIFILEKTIIKYLKVNSAQNNIIFPATLCVTLPLNSTFFLFVRYSIYHVAERGYLKKTSIRCVPQDNGKKIFRCLRPSSYHIALPRPPGPLSTIHPANPSHWTIEYN